MSERRTPAPLPRRAVLAGLAASLAGCGFAPVYGPGAAATDLRGALSLRAPTNRAEYAFAARVEEKLGRVAEGPLRLTYTITRTTQNQGFTQDLAILRIGLDGSLDYAVTETATGRVLTSGRTTAFTGYTTTGTVITTPTNRRDAERRLMVMLADRMVEDLALSAGAWLP